MKQVGKGFKTSIAWNALIAQAGKIGIRRGPQVDEYGRYIERAVTNDSIDGGVEGRLSTRRSSRRYLFYIRVSKRYLKKFVSFRIIRRGHIALQHLSQFFSVSWMASKEISFFDLVMKILVMLWRLLFPLSISRFFPLPRTELEGLLRFVTLFK